MMMMMISAERMECLVREHIPPEYIPEDETALEYMFQLLQDEDVYEEPDNLVDSIAPFLTCRDDDGGDGDGDNDKSTALAKTLVEALVKECQGCGGGSSTSTSTSVAPVSNTSKQQSVSAAIQHEPERGAMEYTEQNGTESSTTSPTTATDATSPCSSSSSDVSEHEEEQEEDHAKSRAAKRKEKREQRRKQKQQQKQRGNKKEQSAKKNDDAGADDDNDNFGNVGLEDDASAWKECQEEGGIWGGRGRGGRGAYAAATNSVRGNIHLDQVHVTLSNGTELLQGATIDINKGRMYGLIGRNGCGKSSLLTRLARKSIPGMPHDMRILLVRQEVQGRADQSALEALVAADTDRTSLLKEQEYLEEQMVGAAASTSLEETAERLGQIAIALDAMEADSAEERASDILKGLQFTDAMMNGPTENLSGGWRMRLSLARALFVPNTDLLLLDECTNHLDLHGLGWLIGYLNERKGEKTLVVVSHDAAFLDAICTDIMVMEHQRLDYHVGNYSEYHRQKREKAARESQILDAAERQKTKAMAFVQKQQQQMANKKSADPNKQRQAKMIKTKKLDRIGNYRSDGKRYKLNSLKKMDMDYARLAEKVVVEVDEPVIKMHFPKPAWPASLASSPQSDIFRMENFSFDYNLNNKDSASSSRPPPLLNNITVSLQRNSKVAVVGRNGCGKSTLAKLIAGDISNPKENYSSKEDLWIHPGIKIGHVTQYSVEELEEYKDRTVAEYASSVVPAEVIAKNKASKNNNIRQYLGAYGLGGKHALRKIGTLSGGERMRLCFATVLAEEPHLLLLDESTNHVDMETLDSMSSALNDYEGAVFMVSHNQAFLSGFCRELWVVDDQGKVTVNHSDTETFDDIFAQYRTSIMSTDSKLLRTQQRKEKAFMAKRATQQRAGARQNTGFI